MLKSLNAHTLLSEEIWNTDMNVTYPVCDKSYVSHEAGIMEK